jgi:hypothetical protein
VVHRFALEYQFGGLIGYEIKPRSTLYAGYRYLGLDYRSGGFIFDVITSGALAGAAFNLKAISYTLLVNHNFKLHYTSEDP